MITSDYQFISVTGRIMGQGTPADHWETMAARGFPLVYGASANLFIDRSNEYIMCLGRHGEGFDKPETDS